MAVAALPTLPHRLLDQQAPYRVVDPDVHLDVAVPQLAGAPVLNRRLVRVAATLVDSFRRTLRHDAGRPHRYHAMTVGWQLLGESRRAAGIQLWVAQQHGLEVRIERVSTWYDTTTKSVLNLPGVFRPRARPAMVRAIVDALTPAYRSRRVRAALAAGPAPQGKQPSFGFTATGDLLVTFAARVLSSGNKPLSVRLGGPALASRLSPAGRSARAAAGAHPVRPNPAPTDCTKRHCVALTFDDGPGSFTAELVALLRQREVPATFFVVGNRIRQSADLVATVSAAGMEIGNHSTYHRELPLLGVGAMKRDLAATDDAIAAATGRRPTLLRPPYGSRNATVDRISRRLGLAEVLWDVDTLDWRYPDSDRVRDVAVAAAGRGSIILLHDVHRTSVAAVPGIIRGLRRRGFTLVTVSDLLVDPPQAGHVYRQQGSRSRHHQLRPRREARSGHRRRAATQAHPDRGAEQNGKPTR